jgi:hypothetical protein
MRLLISLGLLQVALSIAAIIKDIAIDDKSSINETEFEGILATNVESSSRTKRFVIADESWCNGTIHSPDIGHYKPDTAVCNWALDCSYKVYCVLDGATSVWVQAYCDIGFYCKQLAFVKSLKGSYAFDVACVPSNSLVKWAIGSRQSGRSYTQLQ